MVEHHIVHNSEVYLLGLPSRPSIPPPSPPSPVTPTAADPGTPVDQLCLDGLESIDDRLETERVARQRLSGAVHVLNTEAAALRDLTTHYETDDLARASFSAAVAAITRNRDRSGKVVFIGVGKSGHIAKKLVATFNSLDVKATFLHPTEALHGDLGKIGKHDTVLFITFSGKTSELLAVLPHIDTELPAIIITSHKRPSDCQIVRERPGTILLPAPIHEAETVSFGVSAPTTSTTVALALGDALAVVVSQELHQDVSSVFARNHPGGAIGASFGKPQKLRDIAVPFGRIAQCTQTTRSVCGADVLKAGYDSPSGWVGVGDVITSPSRLRRLDPLHLSWQATVIPDLLVQRSDWINIAGEARISQAADWIRNIPTSPGEGEVRYHEGSILAVIDEGQVIGVLEAGQLLSWEG